MHVSSKFQLASPQPWALRYLPNSAYDEFVILLSFVLINGIIKIEFDRHVPDLLSKPVRWILKNVRLSV